MSVRGVASWATAAVVGAVTLAACGGHETTTSSASPSPSSYTGGTSPSPDATADPTRGTSAKPSTKKDPVAPSTFAPVVRDGRTPRPTVTAAPASLKGVVRYPDGVSLQVAGIKQGTVDAKGPGEIEGPITTFSLRLVNGSRRSLNLSQVVVTLVYGGRPGRVAQPTYTGNEQDFSGVVRPGATARATYTFAVPVSARDAVTVHVDFDAVHAAATLSGSTS